jgi:hypothetical protein
MKFSNGTRNRTTAVRRVATQVRASQRRLEKLAGVCAELNLNWQGEWLTLLAGHLETVAKAIDLDADVNRSWRGKRQRGDNNRRRKGE